jgi:hypothetical protein
LSALDELRTLLGFFRESGDASELQPQPSLSQLPTLQAVVLAYETGTVRPGDR